MIPRRSHGRRHVWGAPRGGAGPGEPGPRRTGTPANRDPGEQGPRRTGTPANRYSGEQGPGEPGPRRTGTAPRAGLDRTRAIAGNELTRIEVEVCVEREGEKEREEK